MDVFVRRPRLLLAAVVCGLLLAMLDQTIVGTALPAIVRDLDGASLYLWAVTAYLVPATVSLPVYARLSDRYGRRAMLLFGLGLFLVGSALAASAQGMGQFIAERAVQGLGAGALEGLPFILVADLYAGRRSASLQAALAGLMGLAFILGPLLGGVITDGPGWRWAFLVNVPLGLAALVVVARFLPRSLGRFEGREVPIDVAGMALLGIGVGLVLVGLDQRAVAPMVAGAAVLAAFVAVERRSAAPVVPLRLLADRAVAAMLVAGATATSGLYAGVLLLPRYLESARHVSATRSGLLIYPLLLGLVLATTLAASTINRWQQWRWPVLIGTGLAALGALGFGDVRRRHAGLAGPGVHGADRVRSGTGAVRAPDRAAALRGPDGGRRCTLHPHPGAAGRWRPCAGRRRHRVHDQHGSRQFGRHRHRHRRAGGDADRSRAGSRCAGTATPRLRPAAQPKPGHAAVCGQRRTAPPLSRGPPTLERPGRCPRAPFAIRRAAPRASEPVPFLTAKEPS
ncbi:MFS transporter [Petropleomorpha daqingensis]|uniref:MFS transporter n=1 Tax=Petropleomorpha daqingensis TaxID=2026353 RepID=UPI0015CDE38E